MSVKPEEAHISSRGCPESRADATDAFGLQQVNYFLALPGQLARRGEGWVAEVNLPAGFILITGAAIAGLSYERGPSGMLMASARQSSRWP
jgi:hypothetical protein